MNQFSVYDLASGRVLWNGSCTQPEDIQLQVTEEWGVIEKTIDPQTHYIAPSGEELDRPSLEGFDKTAILADDADTAKIEGLPIPCVVRVDGIDYVVADGTFELTSSMPASYVVEIDHFPYLPFKQEITAQ